MIQFISKLLVSSIIIFMLLLSSQSIAEDLELYLSEAVLKNEIRPKVLLIFDDSGSMSTTDENSRAAYDPNIHYGEPLIDGAIEYIYYTKGGGGIGDITSLNDNRRFESRINGCNSATSTLATNGYYSDNLRQHQFNRGRSEWRGFPNTQGYNIKLVDCKNDFTFSDNTNAQHKDGNIMPSGFPINDQGSAASPVYYTPTKENSNISWDNRVTLYSANFVRYSLVPPNAVRNRMEIAKEAVNSLISSAPGIDFGLMVFNFNEYDSDSGGRVVRGIEENTTEAKGEILAIINGLTPSGYTPLCETLYESSLYLGGKTPLFGKKRNTSGNPDKDLPERDFSIETNEGTYKSPFISCNETIYVVLISDGRPVKDTTANELLLSSSITESDKFTDSNNRSSYLPALAGWMYNNDLNADKFGIQNAEVHTIGFGADLQGEDNQAAAVLVEAAKRGGGDYFAAANSAGLTAALTSFISNIDPSNNSLTSASVASNNFDRTETLNSVYYAMFEPSSGPRWRGNLKKYKVIEGVQQGSNDLDAVNDSTGFFSENVQSYWSSDVDGNAVGKGGVFEMLSNKVGRKMWSDLGSVGMPNQLVKLQYSDVITSLTFPTQADLAAELGVSDIDVNNEKDNIKDMLAWINGSDTDDVNDDGVTLGEVRPDVFGDPLHSKPVVINYGNGDIYVVIGTNHGVLHMFKDDETTNTIDEVWAFMPKEFIRNINPLRQNLDTSAKIYGIDGLITSHITDNNGDGKVNEDDKVWLFFGYRRGGNSYYAIDITNPSVPKVMWTIEGGSGDFVELGQTWSQPKVIFSQLNVDDSTAKPTLIFGGGYDTIKDSHNIGGQVGADSKGKAIFMVDAETGTLVWSLSPSGDTNFNGSDSIPSSIATLDSDGDGFTDRLYAGDTGGNVWRVDMPGSDKSKFSVFKLASLGNADESSATHDNDRRFFSEPDIVRAYITETIDTGKVDSDDKAIIIQQDIPYDAILIGSGDKTNPLNNNNDDAFFMIKDINIKSRQFTNSTVPSSPSPINFSDLADYTDNPFSDVLTTQERATLSLQVSLKSGWFIDLNLLGEKSTSSALVINNQVNFTTYTPPTETAGICEVINGQGWLYSVDLALGIHKYNTSDGTPGDDRKTFISEQFLGTPTLVITDKTNADTGEIQAVGNIIVGRKLVDSAFMLQTMRTYLYVEEEQ
ncbi:MAG TPA: hypothetical protein DIS98_15505 [Colwellia sp.]|nr:hypothetical protein [Colwellia sp.]